jgi:hypothetical protein
MNHSIYPIEKPIEKAIEKEGKQSYAHSENLPGVCGMPASIEEANKIVSILDAVRLYIPECNRTCNRTGKKTGRAVPAARTVYSETVSVAIN